MDLVTALKVFAEVARRRSFSRAAEHLRMANGNVTKHVAWLERRLGAQLLMRTTKSVSVTQAGMTALELGTDIVARIDALDETVRGAVGEARGVLRIGVRASFGLFHHTPVLQEFLEAHPDVQVALHVDDGRANIVAEGWDVSLRITRQLEDMSLVATRLATVPRSVVAADDYLERRGWPASVQELGRHNCLVTSSDTWRFEGPDGETAVAVSGSLRTNMLEVLRSAALSGQGIAMFPRFMIEEDVRSGRLRTLLADRPPVSLNLYAIFPASRHMPMRVRAFVDFLKARLALLAA
ncbi:LysR family transcriptional regulator [Sphingosinicella terrae]|uniref:LysR family transcriptional regulator n=1 Tax=Sphingosinicella terrae TaxID=2172047 RepID=UPI000E0D51C9|nr:LysR family transcriptional regulator [Sphingosinicella terrae]